jgi:hypothetical protein
MDASARHLRPWRRGPYVVVLLVVLVTLLAWVVVALSSLRDPTSGHLCPLVCVGIALIGITLPLAIRRRRGISRARVSFASNEDALALYRMGRYQAAADAWNDLCHASRHSPGLHVVYVFNLAMASLHVGRLAFARTLIERVRSSGWIGAAALRHVAPSTEVGLGLALALGGELDEARRIVDALEPRLSEARRTMTLLVRAVIDAREGREVSVDDDTLRAAEGTLMLAHIRALRLLSAFTRARGDAVYRESAAELGVDVRPGELDFLSTEWPELRAFMDARGLLAKRD